MKKSSKQSSEVETDDDTTKGHFNTIWRKLRSHPWFAMIPILGLLLTFFGINFESVKSVFDWEFSSTPEETFFSTLESVSAVRNKGGTVNPPNEANFAEGGCGKGFISKKSKEVITFPIEGKNLKNLAAGTVELCVTLTQDLADANDEMFLFMAYERDYDAIFLQLIDKDTPENPARPVARMRIKRGRNSDPKWVNAESEELNWKKGEHHHLAGTWGEDGIKLYIDGQLITHNPTKPARPTKHPDSFTINNDSADTGNNPTHCIVRNLRISNYPKTEMEVKESYDALHPNE